MQPRILYTHIFNLFFHFHSLCFATGPEGGGGATGHVPTPLSLAIKDERRSLIQFFNYSWLVVKAEANIHSCNF